jgi:hypothetical protein
LGAGEERLLRGHGGAVVNKVEPLGICDHCLGTIPADMGWYTSKGKPRLYCGRDCRNAANSQAGAVARSRKAKERVQRGEWQNPHHLNPPTPEEQGRRASLGRKREVEAGTWRNPADSPEAREKLSRPRKHDDNPVLHRALEKLKSGTVADLTDEEAEAHRVYRRTLVAARRAELNARARERYHEQQETLTEEAREAQRARWREANRRRAKRENKR